MRFLNATLLSLGFVLSGCMTRDDLTKAERFVEYYQLTLAVGGVSASPQTNLNSFEAWAEWGQSELQSDIAKAEWLWRETLERPVSDRVRQELQKNLDSLADDPDFWTVIMAARAWDSMHRDTKIKAVLNLMRPDQTDDPERLSYEITAIMHDQLRGPGGTGRPTTGYPISEIMQQAAEWDAYIEANPDAAFDWIHTGLLRFVDTDGVGPIVKDVHYYTFALGLATLR